MISSWQWAAVAIIPIISLGRGPIEQELKVGDWVTSDDGALSLRLLAYDPVTRKEPIVLMAELRNNSEDELTVWLPFRPEYRAWMVLDVRRGLQDISYSGPIPGYAPGPGDYASIAPGQTVDNSIELPVDGFPSSHWPREYLIRYPYATGNGP